MKKPSRPWKKGRAEEAGTNRGNPTTLYYALVGLEMQGGCMSVVVSFRPFKVPHVLETQFFQSNDKKNQEFAEQDLARSGLTPEDIFAFHHPMMRLKEGAQAGYIIPYFNLEGQPITDNDANIVMFRTRLNMSEFSKENRYTQPSGEQLAKFNLPSFLPYIHPLTLKLDGDSIVCCEGEKKTAAVLHKLGLPAFGIGGCQMWRNPDGSGSIHPWIKHLITQRNAKRILIIPDADIFRYDICNAYGTFANVLQREGIDVSILNPGGKIDDLLLQWGTEASERFGTLEKIAVSDLVQSLASLAKLYNLAFKQNDKGIITAYQHTANIMKLMENHHAFPKIWRNSDNNKVMVGDDPAAPDLTEMEIANYFQYNLGMDKVGHRTIYSCIQALAKRNARSPFLDHIRSIVWDGSTRLDSWVIRHWGASDTSFVREVSSKWLISACARMDKPGTKLDWMLIVVGPQGTGKTSMPSIIFDGLNLTLYGEHNDKDLHMLLHSSLCVGFDELDSFGKRESSNLKAMITRNEDAFRPPYGASVEIFPRRFTLYGCGNRHEFLQHDPSGYRRYAIIEIARLLDFAGLAAERDQLWAESWQRYQSGETYWEIADASSQAEQFVSPNLIEDQIIGWIRTQATSKTATNVVDGKLYFSMTHLLAGIGMDREVKNPHFTREVAAILHGLGAKKSNTSKAPVPGLYGRHYEISV